MRESTSRGGGLMVCVWPGVVRGEGVVLGSGTTEPSCNILYILEYSVKCLLSSTTYNIGTYIGIGSFHRICTLAV